MKKLKLCLIVCLILFISVPSFAEPDKCCPDININTKIKNIKMQGAVGNGNVGIQTDGNIKNNIINTGDTIDNSILKNADLRSSQNGLVNVRGSQNQAGIQTGTNNNAVNGDNNGIIIQQSNTSGNDNSDDESNQNTNTNINAMVDNSTAIYEDKREFAPGHGPVVAGFMNYTGSEIPGYTYVTFQELLTFGNVFTESQLISMAGSRGFRRAEVNVTLMDSNMARQKPSIHSTKKQKMITVYIKSTIPTPIRRGAFITIAMKSVKGASVECLGKAGVEALRIGANSLFVTAEGFNVTTSQHSIAIGPGISFSSIGGSDQSKGVTGGGGFTYSYGVGGQNYKPFQRFMALYVEDENHKYALRGEEVQK